MSGHIYAVECRPGWVKVGRSSHRLSRIAAYGGLDSDLLAWVSPRFSGYRGAETHLIHRLNGLNVPREGQETFNIRFDLAVNLARTVVADAITFESKQAA